uniref:Uncharacterized protein n=1 Tax=Fagus sylvatica TaxID=28930 RepID=A0A2N9HPK4_FAGSY
MEEVVVEEVVFVVVVDFTKWVKMGRQAEKTVREKEIVCTANSSSQHLQTGRRKKGIEEPTGVSPGGESLMPNPFTEAIEAEIGSLRPMEAKIWSLRPKEAMEAGIGSLRPKEAVEAEIWFLRAKEAVEAGIGSLRPKEAMEAEIGSLRPKVGSSRPKEAVEAVVKLKSRSSERT